MRAFIDLTAVSRDPRLAALGLDGIAQVFGVTGARPDALGDTAQSVTIAGWPRDPERSDRWDTALLFSGRFDVKALQALLGATDATTTMNGERVHAVRVKGASEPMYMRFIDPGHVRIGTAEGMRRWVGAVAAEASGRSSSSAAEVPVGAAAWLQLELGAQPTQGASGTERSEASSDVRALTASVVASDEIELRARMTLVDAASAEQMGASLRMLQGFLTASGQPILGAIGSKLQYSVNGVELAAGLSLDASELVFFRTAVLSLARQRGAAPAVIEAPAAPAVANGQH